MTGKLNKPPTMFFFRAYTQCGEIEQGSVEAGSAEQAIDIIWGRGLTPLETYPVSGHEQVPWWRRDIMFSASKPKPRALCDFTRELATLGHAGIPLDDGLRLICEQTASGPMRVICRSLLASVLDGTPLSGALERHAEVFAPDYINIVRAGETVGDTSQVLLELAALLERRLELSDKIKSALIYPIILLSLAVVSIGVIINVLIPNVAPIFVQNGKELPSLIKQLVALQENWKAVAAFVGAICIGLAGSLVAALRTSTTRIWIDQWLIRTPLLGGLLLKREIARFSRTLGTLLGAGVPMMAAFASAREVVGNRFLALGLEHALDGVRDGRGLAKSLADEAHLPKIALQMIGIGEESGKLDQMLMRMAENFEQQTQRQIDTLMTLLTPALTMFIAGLIGSLIFTVMSAILSINELAIQ